MSFTNSLSFLVAICKTLGQAIALSCASKGFFPGGQQWIFLGGVQKYFTETPTAGIFHFTYLSLGEETFFTKTLMRKYQISKSREVLDTLHHPLDGHDRISKVLKPAFQLNKHVIFENAQKY